MCANVLDQLTTIPWGLKHVVIMTICILYTTVLGAADNTN